MRTAALKACHAVFWLALVLWVAALAAAGVAAAGSFTVLPGLPLTVDGYRLEEAADHGRLAAGMVLEPIFTGVDLAQLVLAPIVLVTVALEMTVFRAPVRSVTVWLRLLGVVAAAALFAVRAATVTPSMNRELRAYWSAAEAGDLDAARRHRAAFDELHVPAARLYDATLAVLLVTVVTAAVAPAPRSSVPGSPRP